MNENDHRWTHTLEALDKQDAAWAKVDKEMGRLLVGMIIMAASLVITLIGIVLGMVFK